jgi:acyl-CoA thioesterase II
MPEPTFSERLELRKIGDDEFENVHELWEWPWAKVIPGGLLMSLAAAAAYRTISPSDFVLDNLQTHFLRGIDAKKPLRFKVTRLSNGKRFVVRSVVIEQDGAVMLHASMTFMSKSKWNGPANVYAVKRKTDHKVDAITLDDLAFGTKPLRPMMKFQRMPLIYQGR